MPEPIVAADHSERSLLSFLDFSDRVAVVTGAAQGLGEQIARRLAEAGASLVLGDLHEAAVAEVAGRLSSEFGVEAYGQRVDIGEASSIQTLAEHAIELFGQLNVWVNNAGISTATGPAVDVDPAFVDSMLHINATGTYIGAREAAKRMSAGSVVVNIVSTTGFRASAGISAYVASKHAAVGVTKALGVEFAPMGVRVIGIAPTIIDTPGVREEMEPLRTAGIDIEQRLRANPFGRVGVADDVARVVIFAASDMSAYMTGSTIAVDAGRLA